eukprot:Gb_28924 [translate_table: standard]
MSKGKVSMPSSCLKAGICICMLGFIPLILAWWWQSVVRDSVIDPWPTLLPFPPPRLQGIYAPNTALHGIEKIGEGLLPGPEDLAIDSKNGYLYTGCGDGWIKRVSVADGKVENWTYVGGRPLGLVMGNHGELLVCEPFQGLLNVTQGNFQVLSDEVEGKRMKFVDGLDVRKDGTIYFTDASTKFGFGYSDYDVLEGRPNGRLLKYNPTSHETTILLTNLFFPNGLALSGDHTFLIFCETSKVRCSKYWLQGQKKGQVEIFIDNLPGYPDNIRYNGHGIFWIGLVSKRSATWELIMRASHLKHFITTKMAMKKIGEVALSLGRVVGIRENDGRPLYMYEDPSAKAISFVTTGLQDKEYLYLGGLGLSHIGRLHLNISC